MIRYLAAQAALETVWEKVGDPRTTPQKYMEQFLEDRAILEVVDEQFAPAFRALGLESRDAELIQWLSSFQSKTKPN